jgi:hypothetical protein
VTLDQLFKNFDVVERLSHGFLGSRFTAPGLDPLAAAIDSCLCPLLAADWKYVSFIRARKSREEDEG